MIRTVKKPATPSKIMRSKTPTHPHVPQQPHPPCRRVSKAINQGSPERRIGRPSPRARPALVQNTAALLTIDNLPGQFRLMYGGRGIFHMTTHTNFVLDRHDRS